MKYLVRLQQDRTEFATVEVEAASDVEAGDKALDLAEAGSVDWARGEVVEGTLRSYDVEERS